MTGVTSTTFGSLEKTPVFLYTWATQWVLNLICRASETEAASMQHYYWTIGSSDPERWTSIFNQLGQDTRSLIKASNIKIRGPGGSDKALIDSNSIIFNWLQIETKKSTKTLSLAAPLQRAAPPLGAVRLVASPMI